MPDFGYTFELDRLYKTARHRAARAAVFRHAGRTKGEGNSQLPSEIYPVVLDRWRSRLGLLKQFGWAAVNTSMKIAYARNCSPFGVAIDGIKGRPCHHVRICPWCYGREVFLEGFSAIEHAIYGSRPSQQARVNRLLVAGTRLWRFPWDDSVVALSKDLQEARWDDYDNCQNNPPGGVVFIAMWPSDGFWCVRRVTVALVESVNDLPAFESTEMCTASIKAADDLSRKSIGKLLTRVIPYPDGAMFGDAAKTVSLLTDTRFPAIGTRGLMRNKSQRAMLAQKEDVNDADD